MVEGKALVSLGVVEGETVGDLEGILLGFREGDRLGLDVGCEINIVVYEYRERDSKLLNEVYIECERQMEQHYNLPIERVTGMGTKLEPTSCLVFHASGRLFHEFLALDLLCLLPLPA